MCIKFPMSYSRVKSRKIFPRVTLGQNSTFTQTSAGPNYRCALYTYNWRSESAGNKFAVLPRHTEWQWTGVVLKIVLTLSSTFLLNVFAFSVRLDSTCSSLFSSTA